MKNKKKTAICCTMTAAVLTMAVSATASADDIWSYRAVADSLEGVNIRAYASEDSTIVGYLPTGGVADVIQGGDEWSLVISGGVEGYVKNEYLALGADAENLANVYGYTGVKTDWDGVNLFSQPDGSSQVVETADAGSEYVVVEDQGDWLTVQTQDGTAAYVAAEDVRSTVVLPRATAADTTGTYSYSGEVSDSSDAVYSAPADTSYDTSYDTGYDSSYDASYDTSYDTSYGVSYDTSYDNNYNDSYNADYDTTYSYDNDTSYDDNYSYDTSYDSSYDASYDAGYDTSYDDSYSYDTSYDTVYSDGSSYDDSSSYDDTTYETEAPAEVTSVSAESSASSSDLDLLAALIYCEAGNQSRDGKVAVGAVVLNRVASGSFANSISGVIYESGQFTPAMTGWLDQVVASGAPSDCYEAAQAALNGENPVGSALYFNVGSGRGIQIGAHQFY